MDWAFSKDPIGAFFWQVHNKYEELLTIINDYFRMKSFKIETFLLLAELN